MKTNSDPATKEFNFNAHYQKCLLKSIEELFEVFPLDIITSLFNQLNCCFTNPDDVKDYEPKVIVNTITETNTLIHFLSTAYVRYNEYVNTKESKGGE